MVGSPVLGRDSVGKGEGVGRGKGVDGFVDFVWTFPTCEVVDDGLSTIVLAGTLTLTLSVYYPSGSREF